MVRTGARAGELGALLERLGLRPAPAPPAPRLPALPAALAQAIVALYHDLGGTEPEPRLRPGSWDLGLAGDIVVELDEEPACLKAALWGKRWTNPSTEALFGPADPLGRFDGNGAPRWKQRALYDAMKDAAALAGVDGVRLVRLSTHDVVDGVRLGDALERRVPAPLEALRRLFDDRST